MSDTSAGFFVVCVVGFLVGGGIGFFSARSEVRDFADSEKVKSGLRTSCVAGNNNACRIYEIEWGQK